MKLITLVLGCTLCLWFSEVRACVTPGFVNRGGVCAFDPLDPLASRDFSSIRHAEGRRHKRQTVQGTCPYCARGIFTPYPMWDDCSRYYLCIDGINFEVNCTTGSPDTLFFNPTMLWCESTPSANNSCVFRNYVIPNVTNVNVG